jgi:hypothetical protein
VIVGTPKGRNLLLFGFGIQTGDVPKSVERMS